MEAVFLSATACLAAFMVLAVYDGFYLHLWRYELFRHPESKFEHLTHTIRAVLFPLLVWLMFIRTDMISFRIGLIVVVMDLIVLAVDAYSEKDSRVFMNGLPRWEYIIHLFANGFHFAVIVLIIASRIKIENNGLHYTTDSLTSRHYPIFKWAAVNALPGAVLLGLLHILLLTKPGRQWWYKLKAKTGRAAVH